MYYKRRLFVSDLGFARWYRDILGVYRAARFMQSRGWSLEAALFNLLQVARRD